MVELEPGPRRSEPSRRRRWAVSLRGLMALVLVVGGLVGWYVRQARVRREALAVIQAAGGNVSFVDQRADSSGWSARLYRGTGDDFFREVDRVDLLPPSPLAATDLPVAPTSRERACAAVARLGWVERVILIGGADTAAALAQLASARLGALFLGNVGVLDDAVLAQVRRLRQIRALTISATKPTGSAGAIAAAVAELAQLEEIELFGLDGLSGADLVPLGSLRNLKRISIDRSPAAEDCLDRLGPLDRLTALAFEETRVTDAGLRRLVARAPRLRSLALDGSLLTDRGIEALADLPDLELVTLSGPLNAAGRLTDASLATLGKLRSLRFLSLGGGRFTAAGLDALQGLPLDRLDLDAIEASEAALARLVAGRTFSYLGLHGPGVTDAVLPHLAGHLTGRSTLDLSRSRITDGGTVHLAALKLRGLRLNATALTDRGLAALTTGTTLRLLTVQDTPITPDGAATFRTARPGTRFYSGPGGTAP